MLYFTCDRSLNPRRLEVSIAKGMSSYAADLSLVPGVLKYSTTSSSFGCKLLAKFLLDTSTNILADQELSTSTANCERLVAARSQHVLGLCTRYHSRLVAVVGQQQGVSIFKV